MRNKTWIKKLNDWSIENPISNTKNDYVGLSTNKEEYMSVTKLMLPLGDTYKKDIPKELENLTTLRELLIIARNVKEIPSEIFHLPNLKKVNIIIDSSFQIKDQDLKVLINNGCENIRINTLERNMQCLNTIKDNRLLNYLEKYNLYITSKNFGISKDDLYQISKEIAFRDKEFSEYMVTFLEKKHKLGYEAFIYAKTNNEEELNDIINFMEMEYEMIQAHKDYVNCMLEIAISIVEIFPFKALDILEDINETYSILGSLPVETLDLSVDIVCSIAKNDIEESLKYLDIIEVDVFKVDALEKLSLLSKSNNITKLLSKMALDITED